MSGVAGAERIRSRNDFKSFVNSYKSIISKFPGFVSMQPSGSYVSNLNKTDFGDIDLVVYIQTNKDKANIKKDLVEFFIKLPETVIVPFSSPKYTGKRTYNAGELISVRFHDPNLGYSVQIDNIIALDYAEAKFKEQFLNMPAELQGLILGLVKIATIETDPKTLLNHLGIISSIQLKQNEELEFNLSSVEIQLRKITYKPETYDQIKREILWTSKNFEDLKKILYQYDLDVNFDELLQQAQQKIRNPRSKHRVQGLFNSMISVKSGEQGTTKGANKMASIEKIKNAFGENLSGKNNAVPVDTVVFSFGRFQPPTKGHGKLIDMIKLTAEQLGANYAIWVSKTHGKTPKERQKNPLPIDSKMKYLSLIFPGTNFVASSETTRTPIEVAKYLNNTYKNLVMIVGADRVANFEKLLNEYNGKDYNFDTIKVISAGIRDPDSNGIEGISGTKMRIAAQRGNITQFQNGLPITTPIYIANELMEELQRNKSCV